MKKIAILLTILSLVLIIGLTPIYAEEPIKVSVDGTILTFDVNPTVVENRTLVPLRAIFESLGAEIQWDNATKTVTGIKGNNKIILQIGDNYAMVNGEKKELEVAGKIIDNRTMVPARFIAESLGASVSWDAGKKMVVIASNKADENSNTVTTGEIDPTESILIDFAEYIFQMEELGLGDLENQATDAYSGVTSDSTATDQDFYDILTAEVIPTYKEFLAGLEKLSPKTKEIDQLNKIYIEAAKTNLESFNLMIQALENNDEKLIEKANEKMDSAAKLIEQWEAATNNYINAIENSN
ncbi:hypothetical protein HNQ80_003346 [Anaerosolibacter carboniphilus]|uniref:Copper amine oxidase-like N-terminal domain-containing protein n=1 Tax=Anaerosolibacter carboniphilus TaxID=1417629 RepID=A0A841KV06_9FIRM|nr:copper amine oxidase N-terminal domain-containing protein [Anaerosolibacter carboniphilus]MBB6217227.1 hypothetical protein [Anaerosolibacter carboniphilus]